MKTLYLHIGMHKTATTAIQECLRKNAHILAELGYVVPMSGMAGTTHNNIAYDIRDLPRYLPENGGLEDLVYEITSARFDRFIVSAEALDYLSSEEIGILRTRLAAFDVKVIVYLRRQAEWLQSEWSELVKLRFFQHDLQTLVQRRIANDGRLDYFVFLENWAGEYGRENIRVRVFEKGRLSGSNVFEDFLEACDIDPCRDWQLAERVNVAPGIKTLEVIRAYVRHHSDVLPESTLLSRCRTILEFADREGWNKDKFNMLDRELFDSIQEGFRPTNDKVAKTYLGVDRLFNDDFDERPISVFDINTMTADEILRLVAFLER